MDKFDIAKHYFRGEIKPNVLYEVWGLSEHVVSIVIPDEKETEVLVTFSYMPPMMAAGQDRNTIGVTKNVKKSGVLLVTGRFSSVSWSASKTMDVIVHYAGYPK